MDATRTCLQGDVVGQDDDGFPLQKGMAALESLQGAPLKGLQHPVILHPQGVHHDVCQPLGCNIDLTIGLGRHVLVGRVKGDGEVGRNGPGGGGPDDD